MIPIKAIILNLLSVGAAYGILVWIFQDGHLQGLLNFHSNGGIITWLPLFLFTVTLDIKQLGVGLAVAVLLDATLIRGVLLPAAMKLLGDWNWYLPRWLEWLPQFNAEPELAEQAPEVPPVTAS